MGHRWKFTATRTLTLGFAVIILLGTLTLMLPFASRSGQSLPFADALFTATSATCVTGLAVADTWIQFNLFGQAVILVLIQVGGLGFLSLSLFFPLLLHRRIGLKERSYLMESLSSLTLGGVVRLGRHMLLGTALLEGLGAVILSCRFIPLLGFWQGIWYGIFHAVSAFCNAGFDLMGVLRPGSSLMIFADDPVVVLTVCALILLGGAGFTVWEDLLHHRFRLGRCSLHARVVVLLTALLVTIGTALFLITESGGLLAGLPLSQRLLRALMLAVSPRTAGFNSVELTELSQSGLLVTMLLMFVGAAPGSTGGGLKITTAAAVLCAVFARMRGSSDANLLNRRVSPDQVKQALCSTMWYLLLVTAGVFLLSLDGGAFPLQDLFFEAFSALGTVGLSLGVTAGASGFSRLVLIFLMFAGRIGSVTVFLTVTERPDRRLRNITEPLILG